MLLLTLDDDKGWLGLKNWTIPRPDNCRDGSPPPGWTITMTSSKSISGLEGIHLTQKKVGVPFSLFLYKKKAKSLVGSVGQVWKILLQEEVTY